MDISSSSSSYLCDEGSSDEDARSWIEIDGDTRFDRQCTTLFDLNEPVDGVGALGSRHKLIVRHMLIENGSFHGY